MANELIRLSYVNRVRRALFDANNVMMIGHPGLRGRAREIFLKDMIKPILPPYVELGSGKIVDSIGNESSETDVIIFSRQTLPPLVFEQGFGMYPAEACIYAIEVKSQLNVAELRSTIGKFESLQSLRYLPPAMSLLYEGYGQTTPVIPALFAFGSDLSPEGKDELQRYRELDTQADSNPRVRVLCVARRGYWWFNQHELGQKWIKHPPSEELEEIVDFMGGIANTIPDNIVAKGRPKFGKYLIRPRSIEKH